ILQLNPRFCKLKTQHIVSVSSRKQKKSSRNLSGAKKRRFMKRRLLVAFQSSLIQPFSTEMVTKKNKKKSAPARNRAELAPVFPEGNKSQFVANPCSADFFCRFVRLLPELLISARKAFWKKSAPARNRAELFDRL
ncbi:hypothetical protein, partial [Treponema sp.]|uniref:hypothetical protein n=1 Tax=Treponema sp. TaxID=166 RepID=UPI00298E52E0